MSNYFDHLFLMFVFDFYFMCTSADLANKRVHSLSLTVATFVNMIFVFLREL